MSKQILLCMECRQQSKTDYVYIKEMIDHFFMYDKNKTSIKPVWMTSKGQYHSAKVRKKIAEYVKGFPGDTTVVYFIDIDHWDTNPVDQKMLEDIKNYCGEKGYEFVWLCRDVEDVFLGRQVDKRTKVSEASRFRSRHLINEVDIEKLKCRDYKLHGSNVYVVMEKVLG